MSSIRLEYFDILKLGLNYGSKIIIDASNLGFLTDEINLGETRITINETHAILITT